MGLESGLINRTSRWDVQGFLGVEVLHLACRFGGFVARWSGAVGGDGDEVAVFKQEAEESLQGKAVGTKKTVHVISTLTLVDRP